MQGEVHVLLTSVSFAARPYYQSPACGWCFQALWPSHPAAHTLWHAAHSFHAEHPAALRGTMKEIKQKIHVLVGVFSFMSKEGFTTINCII